MSSKVMLISGSLNTPSRTLCLIQGVAKRLEKQGVEAKIWNLLDRPLPLCNPRYHYDPESHPDPQVKAFIEMAKWADGYVLGSPVYHNSFTGVLKNALDFLTMELVWNKTFGLVAAGGRQRSMQPVDQLRIVVRGLHGNCIPYQVVAGTHDVVPVGNGFEIQHEDILERMDDFTAEFITYLKANALLHHS